MRTESWPQCTFLSAGAVLQLGFLLIVATCCLSKTMRPIGTWFCSDKKWPGLAWPGASYRGVVDKVARVSHPYQAKPNEMQVVLSPSSPRSPVYACYP